MLSPKHTKTVEEHFDNILFLWYSLRNLASVLTLFDIYSPESLKASIKENRQCGVHRRMLPPALLPGNWHIFLWVDDNKTELFQYITQRATEKVDAQGKTLVIMWSDEAVSIPHSKDTGRLEVCSQEKANTRIVLHLADWAGEGLDKILIWTTDTDVNALCCHSDLGCTRNRKADLNHRCRYPCLMLPQRSRLHLEQESWSEPQMQMSLPYAATAI